MKKAYFVITAILLIVLPLLHSYFFKEYSMIHLIIIAVGACIATILIIFQDPKEIKDIEEYENKRIFKEKKKISFRRKLLYYLIAFVILCIIYFLMQKQITHFLQSNPWIVSTFNHVREQIAYKTLLGLFYVALLGALFFFSIPLELVFFYYHEAGHPGIYLILICTLGSLAGFIFNYFIGFVVGEKLVKSFFKENYEKMRKIFEKFGGFVLVFGNIIPFPIEVVVMIAGAMRYNFKNFIIYNIVGKLIKFTLLLFLHQYIVEKVIPLFSSFF